MTRWHADDLAGRILEEAEKDGERWEVLRLPALAEFGDQIGREEGQPLWPARYDTPALRNIEATIGSYNWNALYQQRPSAIEGAIWKREYWRYYDAAPRCQLTIQAWDTAFQDKQSADYSVCTTWGVGEQGLYLLDRFRQRLEFPQLVDAAASQYDRWWPNVILVEDHASGQSLVQVFQQQTRLPILARKVETSKEIRAWAVVGLAESGRLFLPAKALWLNEYLSEMEDFPHGKNDDSVDSTTLALNYLRTFVGAHLNASSDVDMNRELPASQGFGNEYERPSLGFGRGSELAPHHTSRWKRNGRT